MTMSKMDIAIWQIFLWRNTWNNNDVTNAIRTSRGVHLKTKLNLSENLSERFLHNEFIPYYILPPNGTISKNDFLVKSFMIIFLNYLLNISKEKIYSMFRLLQKWTQYQFYCFRLKLPSRVKFSVLPFSRVRFVKKIPKYYISFMHDFS